MSDRIYIEGWYYIWRGEVGRGVVNLHLLHGPYYLADI